MHAPCDMSKRRVLVEWLRSFIVTPHPFHRSQGSTHVMPQSVSPPKPNAEDWLVADPHHGVKKIRECLRPQGWTRGGRSAETTLTGRHSLGRGKKVFLAFSPRAGAEKRTTRLVSLLSNAE